MGWLKATNIKSIRWSFLQGKKILTDGYCGKEINFKKPKGKTKNYIDWNSDEKKNIYSWIYKFKAQILGAGCLCYDDAYFLASASLQKNPAIKLFLQKRFTYVFVDEMQDLQKHQHNLLEEIFFDNGASKSIYQRIGDKNQSIYDEKETFLQSFWNDRQTILELNGSYRLSPILAGVVSPFAISPLRIEGRRKNTDGSDVRIKPHLIVFSDKNKEYVIPRFSEIINLLVNDGRISPNPRNKYKAIAWTTKKEDGKLRLTDYFPDFSRQEQQRATEYLTLESYITSYDKEDRTLFSIERSICNSLLRILREEEIVDANKSQYTKSKMRDFLKEANPNYFSAFEAKIYKWCLSVTQGESDAVLADIKINLPEFISQFGARINKSSNFINETGSTPISVPISVNNKTANVFQCNSFKVEVSTIHRVKGETHTATLYMETFYERGGGGNYESERLTASLKGDAIKANSHNLVKQSAKMVYVGFSRPTHLLCFSVHESRFAKIEKDIDQNIWEIVRLECN